MLTNYGPGWESNSISQDFHKIHLHGNCIHQIFRFRLFLKTYLFEIDYLNTNSCTHSQFWLSYIRKLGPDQIYFKYFPPNFYFSLCKYMQAQAINLEVDYLRVTIDWYYLERFRDHFFDRVCRTVGFCHRISSLLSVM